MSLRLSELIYGGYAPLGSSLSEPLSDKNSQGPIYKRTKEKMVSLYKFMSL